jgi:hypothetical protein
LVGGGGSWGNVVIRSSLSSQPVVDSQPAGDIGIASIAMKAVQLEFDLKVRSQRAIIWQSHSAV